MGAAARGAAFVGALRTRRRRPPSSTRQQAQAFGSLYAGHLRVEETLVFPAARSRMDSARLAHMSADMQRRRQPGARS